MCKGGKWVVSFDKECKEGDCSEIVFDRDIAPIISEKCSSCHTGFDTFSIAQAKADQYITRTSLADNDPQRMPKSPSAPLDQVDKDKLKEWKTGGLLETCQDSDVNNNPHIDLDDVESSILQDLDSQPSASQLESRYLIISNKSNEKALPSVLSQFSHGVSKASNSISFARDIVLPVSVDEFSTVFRIFLKDLKLAAADWALIEAGDPLNFESFTNKGALIKQLTGARKPWLIIDSFAFTSNQAPTYYALRKLPAKEQELFVQLGVDVNQELADFTALFLGFANSPISLNKNRLLTRFDSNDGAIFITFDTDNRLVSEDRNLFSHPLLKSASGKANFVSDASELIFSLPNQLHGYYLSNAKGDRQNAAPLTVVSDNVSPFSPEIKSSLSCLRCHNAGYIPAKDEIRAHVIENAVTFSLDDVEFVELFYREPESVFKSDNAKYAIALSQMGISASDVDPINLVADNLRRNQDAKSVAALLLLTEDEFLEGLSRSAEGREQVGSLLTGGTITFQQLIASLPILIRDLRLFQNPL